MKKKLYSIFWLLAVLHILPILQGCPPCNTQDIVVSATDVTYRFYSVTDNDQFTENGPYDSQTLRLWIELFVPDSVIFANALPVGLLSSAVAMDCDDFYVEIAESIQDIQIKELLGDGSSKDLTGQFYAEYDDMLYQSVEDLLKNDQLKFATLFSGWSPTSDSAEMVITTTLTDDRVFADTVKLYFQ